MYQRLWQFLPFLPEIWHSRNGGMALFRGLDCPLNVSSLPERLLQCTIYITGYDVALSKVHPLLKPMYNKNLPHANRLTSPLLDVACYK